MEVLEENKLQVIVKESGLEETKAQTILEKFQDYYKIAAEWETKAKALTVTDVTQVAEMKMAREGRLFLKGKRVDIEKARKDLKEQCLREGKAIDGIANVLKALIEPIETYLEEQEKFAEIEAAKQKEIRKAERMERLSPYGATVFENMIADMDDTSFENYFTGVKTNYEAKIEAEKQAEIASLEREKAEQAERDRIREENERLKAEAAERERVAEIERKEREAERKAAEEKAAKDRAEIEAKTKAEREESERKLAAERAERERVQKELQAKKEAEEKARAEEQQKIDADLAMGDKAKFESLIAELENLTTKYVFKSAKFKNAYASVNDLLNKTINYAISKK